MPLVQGSYRPGTNPLLMLAGGPPIDTDPYSPTYGSPTFSNIKPRANTPDVDTTAKGNPGQPAPSVPTTAAPNAAPPLPNVDATLSMEPGTPKAQAKEAPKAAATKPQVPDYLGNLDTSPQEAKPAEKPAETPAEKPAEGGAKTPDYLGNLDTSPKETTPAYTGQVMYSATSPGAKAVGTPPIEGFVPGGGFQAAINTATDPGQRAAIAAEQLKIPLDRIIVDAGGGRMAAVGDNGVPYYITPPPFTTDQSGITKATGDQRYASGPNLAQRLFGAPGAGETEPRDPGGPTDQGPISQSPWQPTGTKGVLSGMLPLGAAINPYDRTAPVVLSPTDPSLSIPGQLWKDFNEASSRDIGPTLGGAIPNAISNVVNYPAMAAGEMYGGPLGAAIATGATDYTVGAGRQAIANMLTPDAYKDYRQAPFTSDRAKNALLAAGLAYLPMKLGRDLGVMPDQLPFTKAPSGEGVTYNTGLAPIGTSRGFGDRQQSLGFQGQLAPWEAPQRWEPGFVVPSPETNPPGTPPLGARVQPPPISEAPPATTGAPSMPVPGAEPLRPGETWLPGQETEATGGAPNAKSQAQIVAEDRAIPTDAPPMRFPLMGDASIKERAKDVLRWYMSGGNTTPEPGVEGNLAEVTGNRGAAALLRSMRDRAGPVANDIGAQEEERAATNRATLTDLKGDEDQLNTLREARRQQTADLEAKAVAGKTTTNPTDVQDAVVQQLNSPVAQDLTVADALRDIHERLYQHDPLSKQRILDENGNPVLETDPERLMRLRQSLSAEMTRQAQSGRPDMRAASLHLAPILDQLDTAITRGMPDYPAFNAAYREASKPITAMEYFQGRAPSMVDAATGTPQLGGVQRTLDNIYNQRVLKKGWQPAMDIPQDQIDQLTALRDQLRREHNIRNGMSIGPATFEKFTTSQVANLLGAVAPQVVRRIGTTALGVHEFGLGGMILGGLEAGAEHLAAMRRFNIQQKFNAELTKLLLNRNGEGVAALREAPGAPNALQQ